jgi:hypothetical protein
VNQTCGGNFSTSAAGAAGAGGQVRIVYTVGVTAANELENTSWKLSLQTIAENEKLQGILTAKENTDMKIELLDMQGRILHSEKTTVIKGENFLKISLDGINNGIYFLKLYNESEILNRRFVKM